jgi:hypothetical protein
VLLTNAWARASQKSVELIVGSSQTPRASYSHSEIRQSWLLRIFVVLVALIKSDPRLTAVRLARIPEPYYKTESCARENP